MKLSNILKNVAASAVIATTLATTGCKTSGNSNSVKDAWHRMSSGPITTENLGLGNLSITDAAALRDATRELVGKYMTKNQIPAADVAVRTLTENTVAAVRNVDPVVAMGLVAITDGSRTYSIATIYAATNPDFAKTLSGKSQTALSDAAKLMVNSSNGKGHKEFAQFINNSSVVVQDASALGL